MNMLWTLLTKDFARIRRNPWPLLINLAIPLAVTAIMGMVFGPSSKGGGVGKIKFAIVDNDNSPLSSFLRGSFSQDEAAEHFEPTFYETREEALVAIQDEGLSAALIIPEGFMEAYMDARVCPPMEVIKNPAQSFYPAIVEEAASLFSTALNAISYNLADEFPEWLEVLETEGRPDFLKLAAILTKLEHRFSKADDYLFPPLVSYQKSEEKVETEEATSPVNNVFAFMLPALSTMFLMFLADGAIRDLYRELTNRTLTRFRTFSQNLQAFVVSKVIYATVLLLISSAVLFVGGTLIFSITWESPFKIAAVCAAFSLLAAGFMSLLAALARSEKKADAINGMIIMVISFAGGSFFTMDALPEFISKNISPFMPNYWFIESIRSIQFGRDTMNWSFACLLMIGLGVLFSVIAAIMLKNNMAKGRT